MDEYRRPEPTDAKRDPGEHHSDDEDGRDHHGRRLQEVVGREPQQVEEGKGERGEHDCDPPPPLLEHLEQHPPKGELFGLLPAGMVLTGGTAALPGIKRVASQVLGMPVRTAQPENLTGLVDRLYAPAYSTGVGLLRWALSMHDHDLNLERERRSKGEKRMDLGFVKKLIGRILP